jgi:hypothetical protein
MIGGTDIELTIRSEIPAADVIFRTVRRYWPNFVFEDADDETVPYIQTTERMLPETSVPEFFVYRDKQAALSWEKHGAISENFNTMLHVILGTEEPPGSGMRPLTLVCDDVVGEMCELIEDLKRGFEDLSTGS